jgi:hypothetical protein
MVAQIKRLSNPRPVAGDVGIAFTVDTTVGQVDFAVPRAELGQVLQFFASALTLFSGGASGPPTSDLFPIPVDGIGFQAGERPGTQLMIVSIGGFGLALEIENSVLASMGEGLSRTARALSADDRNKPS